jgi:hypothetical protein
MFGRAPRQPLGDPTAQSKGAGALKTAGFRRRLLACHGHFPFYAHHRRRDRAATIAPSANPLVFVGVCTHPSGSFYTKIHGGIERLILGTFATMETRVYDAAAWHLK